MGQILGNTINQDIDRLVENGRDRGDVVSGLAEAMGIDVSTLAGIRQGEIMCPPIERLRGAARFLGRPVSRYTGAAGRDGCSYSEASSKSWYIGKR